jgi:hypothetical protein
MNEDQLTRLRGRLERRKKRLEESQSDFFQPMLRRFYDFLTTNPVLTPILDELRANETGCQAALAAQREGNRPMPGVYPPPQVSCKEVVSIASDNDYAAYAYHLVHGVVKEDWQLQAICLVMYNGDPTATMNYDYSTFHRQVLAPLCDHLDERLDEQQAILGLLVRYKKRCEWFNRRELLKTAQDEQASKGDEKKRAEVEKVLKEDLYLYLHDQGMEFTIEPPSDRGEIDLILDQTVGDRKYLEGKVFDNAGRNKGDLIKGFGQLLHYLRQYNASNGYLLIYKTCEQQLVFDGAEQLGTIPYICCEGKTVFILVVDICEYQKPVSQRTYQPVRITAEELRKADPTN